MVSEKSPLQKDFEEWYGDRYSHYALTTWDGCRYANTDTQLAWNAWQVAHDMYKGGEQ